MIVTDDDRVAMLCRSMRNQGRDEGAGWLQHARLGYNYRLSDINCALGISQLARIEEILVARRRIASWYAELLAGAPEVETPQGAPDVEISWFVYVVRLAEAFTREQRDQVLDGLRARGIGCSNYFSPIHLQPFYGEMFGYREGDFPVTESVASRTIALPFFNRLTREQVAVVASAVSESISEARR